VSAKTPEPEQDPGHRRPRREPRMPRAGRGPAGFARATGGFWWRDFLNRVTSAFRSRGDRSRPRPRQPYGLPDLLDMDDPKDSFSFETPAKGDGYNFVVGVRCAWHVQATAYPENKRKKTLEIQRLMEKHRPVIRERIEETIRPEARKFAPYRAAEAEKYVNSSSVATCISDGDVQVDFWTRIDVCDQVREDLKKVWQNRLAEDAQGDLKKDSVTLIGELQEQWQLLLRQGLEGVGKIQEAKAAWIAPYALALAQEPRDSAADYLRNMIEHRVSHAEDLLTKLSTLTSDQRVEAIEFAFESDSALRAVLAYLGVDIPARKSMNGHHKDGAESNA
jgi:hypothetical protein